MGLIMDIHTANWQTLVLSQQKEVARLTIHRPEANNSLNATLVKEMLQVLSQLEQNPTVKVLMIEGNDDFFCTGLDFNTVEPGIDPKAFRSDANAYYELLQRFTLCSCMVVSLVKGKVNAGGIGLIAASDLVIAGEQAAFSLSEALFGLLPACVMPFLIRRVGFQKAKWMTLTTQTLPASKALEIGLVDEVSANPKDALRRNLLRLTRLETETIGQLKTYMDHLWILDEQTRDLAVNQLTELMSSPKIQSNIHDFVHKGTFPWSK